jgi:hypothetical protein
VQSHKLKKNILRNWVHDAEHEARLTIQQRVDMEASIRKDETHENEHALDNPEVDADGVVIAVATRQKIQNMNNAWKERMQLVMKNKDIVNEWELKLLALNLLVGSSNMISYFMGVLRFVLSVLVLYTDSTENTLFILLALLAFAPYTMITVGFPIIMRMGVSLYISDGEVMLALGWIIKPVRLCMNFIIFALSKCRAVGKYHPKENTTRNVVLGCVSIEMVDTKRNANDSKVSERMSADDKLTATISPLYTGQDFCIQDDFIPQSVTSL